MAFKNSYSSPKTIHDSDEGDSQIYVGIKYLGIVAQQIDQIRIASQYARRDESQIIGWLIELQTFYDLIENRTGIHYSKEKIKLHRYKLNPETNRLERTEEEVDEKDKYEIWFDEIMRMIERNANVQILGGGNRFMEKKYLNNKDIILELSRCHRELLRDANKKHLIMPEGVKDMKQQVKQEWLDREVKKEF